MAKNNRIKRIKITSKGIVTTSRGRCRTPIAIPYSEKVDVILSMISQDKATVIEVLPDGREIELNIYNFAQNNGVVKEQPVKVTPIDIKAIKADVVETPPVVEQTVDSNRHLTRKERRELERRNREASLQKPVEETTPVVQDSNDVPVESSEISDDLVTE